MKRLCTRLAVLSLFAAITSRPETSLAEDAKLYNGSACVFTEPNSTASHSQERSFIKLKNTSSSTQTFTCPIVKDDINGNIEYAYIIASDNMAESSCQLWERELNGGYAYWSRDDVDDSGGGYNKTEWFPGSAWGDSSANVSFAITCDLPAGSIVLSYYFSER